MTRIKSTISAITLNMMELNSLIKERDCNTAL